MDTFLVGYLDHILYTLLFSYCPATGMHVEGLPRIILDGRRNLVKMLIILEPHGIF